MSDKLAVRSGFWLFIDLLVMSVGGWIFWLTVSTITTPTEVGYATTTIGLLASLPACAFQQGLNQCSTPHQSPKPHTPSP